MTTERSARSISVSRSSRSRAGSTEPSGCGTASDVKPRTTTARPSICRSSGRFRLCAPPFVTPGHVHELHGRGRVLFRLEHRRERVEPRVGHVRDAHVRLALVRRRRRRVAGQEREESRLARKLEAEDAEFHAGIVPPNGRVLDSASPRAEKPPEIGMCRVRLAVRTPPSQGGDHGFKSRTRYQNFPQSVGCANHVLRLERRDSTRSQAGTAAHEQVAPGTLEPP